MELVLGSLPQLKLLVNLQHNKHRHRASLARMQTIRDIFLSQPLEFQPLQQSELNLDILNTRSDITWFTFRIPQVPELRCCCCPSYSPV